MSLTQTPDLAPASGARGKTSKPHGVFLSVLARWKIGLPPGTYRRGNERA